MESALTWTSITANRPLFTILISTDSKDLCQVLLSSNAHTYFIHESISFISSSIYIQ